MKAKIINYTGYNYTHKVTGELKQGISISYYELFSFKQDDNRGNFSYGGNCYMNVKVDPSVTESLSHYDIIELIGKDVDITTARAPGSKYESVIEILPL